MATKARKPSADDGDYVSMKLAVLRDQIDKAEKYLRENPWDTLRNAEKREREFRFQKSLSDSLMQWTESYINMCGIMDVYKQLEAAKGKNNLKSGQSVSGIQSFVKNEAISKLSLKKEGKK